MAPPENSPAALREMFDRISPRYILMNRLMTFGRDRAWRRWVVRRAALPPGGRLLDVAAGTGDIALEALAAGDAALVAGVDFSEGMMRAGRRRASGARIRWCCGDALALPFPDAVFDAVTSGYLMRNAADPAAALREQVRVVRPGGMVVCLDTSPPPPGVMGPLLRLHLRVVIPLLGRIVARDPGAYRYLGSSTESFKTPGELAALMEAAGLTEVVFRRFMFGTIAVHEGRRPGDAR